MPHHSSHVMRKCEICGKDFDFRATPYKIALGQGRFCSNACRGRWMTGPRVIRVCETCGKDFTFDLNPSSRERGAVGRFCSHKCYWKGVTTPLKIRFHQLIGPLTDNGCMLWIGEKNKNGYGVIRTKSPEKHFLAHRISWEINRGPIPDDMEVLHNCPGGDNPSCVNPEHLWLGTQLDNIADMVAKGRQLCGEQKPLAKLNDDSVRAIRKRYAAGGITHEELSQHYGVSRSVIGEVISKKAWKHI